MTPHQIQILHIAKARVGYDESAYRLILRNVAGVHSCKQLTNAGFEKVMAVFEEAGFRLSGESETYFRDKAAAQGEQVNERQIAKIRQLHDQFTEICRRTGLNRSYELFGLVRRFSGERTHDLRQLRPREAWNLIEMLKAAIGRTRESDDSSDLGDDRCIIVTTSKNAPEESGTVTDEATSLFGPTAMPGSKPRSRSFPPRPHVGCAVRTVEEPIAMTSDDIPF